MKAAAIGLGAFIALLLGFWGGYTYAGAKTTSNGGSPTAQASPGGGRGNFAGGGFFGRGGGGAGGGFLSTTGITTVCTAGTSGRPGPVVGTITSVTSTSMTVHNPACNTDSTISLSSSVNVTNISKASLSDLLAKATVLVLGTRNTDGTINATAIIIYPAGTTITASSGGGGAGG